MISILSIALSDPFEEQFALLQPKVIVDASFIDSTSIGVEHIELFSIANLIFSCTEDLYYFLFKLLAILEKFGYLQFGNLDRLDYLFQ